MGPDTPTAVAAPSTPDAPGISARVPDVSTGEAGTEVRAVKMPLVDRLASAVVTGAPPILVLLGMWLGWNHGLLVWQGGGGGAGVFFFFFAVTPLRRLPPPPPPPPHN